MRFAKEGILGDVQWHGLHIKLNRGVFNQSQGLFGYLNRPLQPNHDFFSINKPQSEVKVCSWLMNNGLFNF